MDPNQKPPWDADQTLVPESKSVAPGRSGSRPSSSYSGFGGAPVLEAGHLLGGRYEILNVLGQGGMGAVYKAKDRDLDRVVALKVIRPELAGNPAIIQRFKQELILARQVTHRNFIRIFDLGEAEGLKFITMEFVEGRDLRSLLAERGKLPPAEAVEIMQQVCHALEAAHAEGVIHRDLKPQNIMMNKRGEVVIKGVRRLPPLPRDTAVHRLEIPYGRFERRIRLAMAALRLTHSELAAGCLTLRLAKRR